MYFHHYFQLLQLIFYKGNSSQSALLASSQTMFISYLQESFIKKKKETNIPGKFHNSIIIH